MDIFSLIPRSMAALLLKVYIKSLVLFPWAYAGAYAWGNESKAALWCRRLISRHFAKRLKPHLLKFAPDVIVCTHATPAGIVGELIRREGLRAVLVSVITDFTIHRLWIHPATSAYFIAHASLKEKLIAHNVAPEKIHAFGIPVDNAFKQLYDKEKILKAFHVASAARVVLLMGGGSGLLPMERIVSSLNEIETPLCMLMVTGSNKALYRRLRAVRLNRRHQGIVLGFADNVHEIMAASDVLISKAGGLTASEALCAHLPMLIYCPIPGQEEANARFLEDAGVALRIHNPHLLNRKINEIFRIDGNALQKMKIHAERAAKPNAAEEILKYILNNLCI